MNKLINKGKTLLISVSVLALAGLAQIQPSHAWQTTTVTPNLGGGYSVNSFGSEGSSYGTVTPNLGGGYSFNSYGSGGSTFGTVTPNLGGGYNINQW
jgi:uncharacterized membrane protein